MRHYLYSEITRHAFNSVRELPQRKQRPNDLSIITNKPSKSFEIEGPHLLRGSVLNKYAPKINHTYLK
jgi:hypothetical protein